VGHVSPWLPALPSGLSRVACPTRVPQVSPARLGGRLREARIFASPVFEHRPRGKPEAPRFRQVLTLYCAAKQVASSCTRNGAAAGKSVAAGADAGAAGAAAADSGGDTAGTAGAAGAAVGGSADAPHADLGKGDGSDVIELGDSYMSNSLLLEGTGNGIVPSRVRTQTSRL
jgi:hypothetical protein